MIYKKLDDRVLSDKKLEHQVNSTKKSCERILSSLRRSSFYPKKKLKRDPISKNGSKLII